MYTVYSTGRKSLDTPPPSRTVSTSFHSYIVYIPMPNGGQIWLIIPLPHIEYYIIQYIVHSYTSPNWWADMFYIIPLPHIEYYIIQYILHSYTIPNWWLDMFYIIPLPHIEYYIIQYILHSYTSPNWWADMFYNTAVWLLPHIELTRILI